MLDRDVVIKKANGKEEIFDPFKLQSSLLRAGTSIEIADEIVNTIFTQIENGMTTGHVYEKAFQLLKTHERKTASKYSLRRAVHDLGPSGFPFETLVSEVLRKRGYEVKTDVTVKGHCISHEIDVVAWKKDELIMVEAKFHNDYGLKSDTKVALYVKSRFDDLHGIPFTFGEYTQKLSHGWLVTNTKFTQSAIAYAECMNMTLIGWTYPKGSNLEHLIEEVQLHPLTCLTTLSKHQKTQLMTKGTVLCKSIRTNPDLLKEIGISNEDIETTLHEASNLCI